MNDLIKVTRVALLIANVVFFFVLIRDIIIYKLYVNGLIATIGGIVGTLVFLLLGTIFEKVEVLQIFFFILSILCCVLVGAGGFIILVDIIKNIEAFKIFLSLCICMLLYSCIS